MTVRASLAERRGCENFVVFASPPQLEPDDAQWLGDVPEDYSTAFQDFFEASQEIVDLTWLSEFGFEVVRSDSFFRAQRGWTPTEPFAMFSPIGFDQAKTKAVMYCGWNCAPRYGGTELYLLKRGRLRWVVDRRIELQ